MERTVNVTQADRNVAIRLLEAGGQDWQAKEIRNGNGDGLPIVQAFAGHREDSLSALVTVLLDARGILANSGAESGYCMCGDPVSSHNIGSGHAPVDAHSYMASQTIEQIDAALSSLGGDGR